MTLGATIRRLEVDGINVVLGLRSAADYLTSPFYMGATCGRYANRLAGASVTLDGEEFALDANEGSNTLHGGPEGFDKRVWSLAEAGDGVLELRLVSPDGDQGFPGNLGVRARFETTPHALTVTYTATTDAPTVVNLTNHIYFNLDGEGTGSTDAHTLSVNSDRTAAVDGAQIPTGEWQQTAVPAGTAQSVAEWAPLDSCFSLNEATDAPCATLHSPVSGLTVDVHTDQPGLQIYTAEALDSGVTGTSGVPYAPRAGIALETQNLPDAPHRTEFPSAVLRPDEVYTATTTWRFHRKSA